MAKKRAGIIEVVSSRPSDDVIEKHFLAAAVVFEAGRRWFWAPGGCGVFGNDPSMVARLFGDFLLGDGPYSRAFSEG